MRRTVDLIDDVLRAVECVPRGAVVSYGDIAALIDAGPRQVGWAMARAGGDVAWWRVTNARGELPPHLREEALRRWRDEGITTHASGGARIEMHRADLAALADAYQLPRMETGSPAIPPPGMGTMGRCWSCTSNSSAAIRDSRPGAHS